MRYLTLSMSSFSPSGLILIFADFKISSTFSQASFLTFQSLCLNIGINLALIYLEISSLGRESKPPPPPPAEEPASAIASAPLSYLFDLASPFFRGVTLANSSSMSFIVDSLISFMKFLIVSPTCLYIIAKRAIDAFLTYGLECAAQVVAKSIISLIGNILIPNSSIIVEIIF